MFNNDDDNRDYTSREEYGAADKQVGDSRQSVWSSDEYGLPVKEEKQDEYAPAYVDNTYTNSFGNSLAGAFAGIDKNESSEKKTDAKPHTEEKKYLGTSSFGFTKPASNVSKDTHVFNKPKESRPDASNNSGMRFGGFGAEKRTENTAYSQPEVNKPVWSQPVEQKPSTPSDGVYGDAYGQNGYGQGGYSQPEPKPAYSQPIESKPVWSQPVQNSYNQPQNGYSQEGYSNGYSQNGGYDGGYSQPQQRGYYDNYSQGGYSQQGYPDNSYNNGYGYAQDAYGAQQGASASDSAPVQRPLTKEEIKRQQKHDALLQKEQDRQQKEQAKLDKLNLKEQERRQKAADKQAEFEEKERQRQEAAELKKQQAEEALALKQQKEQEALALKQQRMQEAEDKKLADKQAKEDKKRQAQEQKEQAKQDKINKKEQAKLDKEQAKFDKQNKKEEAKQAKLDKKQQAIADKQQAKLDKQSKKSKTTDDDGFADMTEYNEEKKRVPEETDMLGGDFVSAVYGAPSASASAAPVQEAKPAEEEPRIPRYVSSDRQTVLVTLPDKEHMTRKQRKIAKKASRFDEMDLRNYPMTVGKWLGTIIILLIPVINFFACVFWFFGVGNKSRTALIRCFFVISLILLVVLIAALGVGYYFLAQKAQAEVGAESVNEVLIYGVDYVYEALGPVIGADKLLPIRNAIVKALGGQEIQSSSGGSTAGEQTGESVTPFS